MKPIRFWTVAVTAALALGAVSAPSASAAALSVFHDHQKLASEAAPSFPLNATYAQNKTRDDQGEARKEMKAGNHLSLREIEKLVLPKMGGAEYLGPAYDAAAHAYRLKFIKEGRVMYVDVDARTGKIINRSG